MHKCNITKTNNTFYDKFFTSANKQPRLNHMRTTFYLKKNTIYSLDREDKFWSTPIWIQTIVF